MREPVRKQGPRMRHPGKTHFDYPRNPTPMCFWNIQLLFGSQIIIHLPISFIPKKPCTVFMILHPCSLPSALAETNRSEFGGSPPVLSEIGRRKEVG